MADSYDKVAVLQQVIGERLLERLEAIRLEPALILELGSGTGRQAVHLSRCYRTARIVQLDLAMSMLIKSRENNGLAKQQHLLCADAEYLPLADNSADFAFFQSHVPMGLRPGPCVCRNIPDTQAGRAAVVFHLRPRFTHGITKQLGKRG